MNKRFQIFLIVIISFFALACGMFGGTGGSNPSSPGIDLPTVVIPTQAPQSNGKVLYQDDFASDSGKAEKYDDQNGSIAISDGVYTVKNVAENWMWGRISVTSADSTFEIDATQKSGPSDDNTGYGIICRLGYNENDGLDGYIFAISGDGYATIQSIDNNKFTPLVDWAAASAVHNGDSSNHLSASCVGNQLTFQVNGETVAEFTDSKYSTGDFGVAAVSFNKDSRDMQVDFDNVYITQP